MVRLIVYWHLVLRQISQKAEYGHKTLLTFYIGARTHDWEASPLMSKKRQILHVTMIFYFLGAGTPNDSSEVRTSGDQTEKNAPCNRDSGCMVSAGSIQWAFEILSARI